MDKVPMTVQGFKSLESELKFRQQEERPRIILAIQEARAHGDLSENAEYSAAKEAQAMNEGRINELESLISRADVIDITKLSGSTVKFGATVTVIDEDTEAERRYMIVGDVEADVKQGRVSLSSPMARAMIGKKVGDSFEVNTPGGGKAFEITGIQFGL
jgi:transcription elongation factor GreA